MFNLSLLVLLKRLIVACHAWKKKLYRFPSFLVLASTCLVGAGFAHDVKSINGRRLSVFLIKIFNAVIMTKRVTT